MNVRRLTLSALSLLRRSQVRTQSSIAHLPSGMMRSRSPATPASSSPPPKRARLEPGLPALEVNLEVDAQPLPLETVESGSGSHVPVEEKSGPSKKASRKKKPKKHPPPESGSSEEVILRDVFSLLGEETVKKATSLKIERQSPLSKGDIVELTVSELTSNGESLSLWHPPPNVGGPSSSLGEGSTLPWVVVVPFALPGEKIRARIFANNHLHSLGDLVEVISPNDELRDMTRVKCRYFGVCGGCQYQMLSYEKQLDLKRQVVDKAYRNFSELPSNIIPSVLPTIPSPKTYGYRTKITPHFDTPPKSRSGKEGQKPYDLTIGFGEKGRRRVLDIEECVIATPTLNEALPKERARIQETIATFKRGATLLLRDSLDTSQPIPASDPSDKHVCITDYKATVRERIGDKHFEFPAGSFFQNNNSVLLPLVEYVRDAIFTSITSQEDTPTHLVDTYCGAGFFAISLAPHFSVVTGVEISVESIRSARHNAQLNSLPPPPESEASKTIKTETITFTAGKSESIFESVSSFPPDKTVVIIDPPRKGCDKAFLDQLVRFRPKKLVYVSCNVHTQARDIGDLLRMMEKAGSGEDESVKGQTYVIESLRGFDLFPQTAHVESVAVLTLR